MDINNIFNSGKPGFTLENPEKAEKLDGSFDIGKEKIKALKDAVAEIKSLIFEREDLSKSFSDDAEKVKLDIGNFLMSTEAVDADGFRERNGLRQKQIEISEIQMNEKIGCWRDVNALKKELRDLTQELNEKEERMKVLGNILEE